MKNERVYDGRPVLQPNELVCGCGEQFSDSPHLLRDRGVRDKVEDTLYGGDKWTEPADHGDRSTESVLFMLGLMLGVMVCMLIWVISMSR